MTFNRMIAAAAALAIAASAAAQERGAPIIDMPPPPAEVSVDDSSYQLHRNGHPPGEYALDRYAYARMSPYVTSAGGWPGNVAGYAWASTFPAGAGSAWGSYWGGWGWPGWGWSWGRGWGWGCGVWGFPHFGRGVFVPARGVRPVRFSPSSFRRQPF
jgi:hypothetical protein